MAEEKQKIKAEKSSYGADAITVTRGARRQCACRPGMYIGTTGPDGLHHLIWEIFDNSRDEAMGGFANDIEVVLLPGEKGGAPIIRVADNGRGIPTEVHKQTKKFRLPRDGADHTSCGRQVRRGGLQGLWGFARCRCVGGQCTLSTWILRAEVHRDGEVWSQDYAIGKPKSKIKKISSSKLHGTIISFAADDSIFTGGIKYDFDKIVAHLPRAGVPGQKRCA